MQTLSVRQPPTRAPLVATATDDFEREQIIREILAALIACTPIFHNPLER